MRASVVSEILSLSNRLSREFNALQAVRETSGLSGINVQILAYLNDHRDHPVYQRDLECAFSVRRSTVSRVLQLMEDKGYIERVSVEHDGRLKRLLLTEEARNLCTVLSRNCSDLEARVTHTLSDDELLILRHLLDRISTALNEQIQ